MTQRQLFSSGGKWEPIIGYSRAVKVENRVFVAGTTATDTKGQIVGPNDPYAQTVQALKNIERALSQAGAKLQDVVRTRMFVTDIKRWEEYGRAHGDFFHNIRPVTSMVEVVRLVDPAMMIEIEADAIIPSSTSEIL